MATTVTEVVGTSETYTTPQLWEDSVTADMVAADEQQVGKGKNQIFSAAAALFIISGHTTDATRDIIWTTDTGASFADDSDNDLFLVATNGCTLRTTTTYDDVLQIADPFVTVDGLMFEAQGSSGSRCIFSSGDADSLTIKNSIMHSSSAPNCIELVHDTAADNDLVNLLVIHDSNTSLSGLYYAGVGNIINCTVVKPAAQTTSGNGIRTGYTRPTVQNCGAFGFSNDFYQQGGAGWTGDYNGGDDAGDVPGSSGPGSSLTYADQFTDDDTNFKLKSGSDLIDAGSNHALSTVDIFGTTRGLTTSADIGCHEFVAAGGFVPYPNPRYALAGGMQTMNGGT